MSVNVKSQNVKQVSLIPSQMYLSRRKNGVKTHPKAGEPLIKSLVLREAGEARLGHKGFDQRFLELNRVFNIEKLNIDSVCLSNLFT